VQNHHKRHATIGRHVIEEGMERIDTTGRRADADNGKFGGTHIGRRR
jgi:hypothetical protein